MSHNEKNTEKFATNAFVKDEVNRLELKIEKTRTDLVKAIYWAGIIQYIAIIASLIGILNFMMRGK